MEVKVEGTALDGIIQKALLDALGDVGKEALVKHVMDYLTKPQERGYGNKKISPLMEALDDQTREAAQKFFRERMENDTELLAQFEAIYVEAVQKFNQPDVKKKLTDKIAERVAAAFNSDRY